MSKRKVLSDLLHEAEQLTSEIRDEDELPRVSRNLHQIAEAGSRLLSKHSIPGEEIEAKA